MPLYRKSWVFPRRRPLTASVTRARREARRRAIELGAPSAFCRPCPPARGSAWAWCTTQQTRRCGRLPEILERTLAANGHPQALVRTTRVDEPGSEAARELIAEGVLTCWLLPVVTVRCALWRRRWRIMGDQAASGYSADGYR